MKGKTLEILVAVSLFFIGLSFVALTTAPFVGLPLDSAMAITAIAGIVSIFSALVIVWDAFRGKD